MQKNAWNKLREFESRDLIERYIKKLTGGSCSAKRAIEISSNFIQGREYFKNADRASIAVKPLLLYYGVTALSRGLILAISNLSESALKPAHGLSTQSWQKTLSDKNYQDLTVSITQGTFYELLTSTDNKSYLKHRTNAVNYSDTSPIPPLESKIRLVDILQTFPDFQDEFHSWTEQSISQLTVQTVLHPVPGEIEYLVNNSTDSATAVGSIFTASCIKSKVEEAGGIKIVTDQTFFPHYSQSFMDPFNAGMGVIKFTKPVANNIYLSTLGQFYVVSYVLGMLSRYFPSVWISLGRTEKGDSIYPLLIKIIDSTYDYFPSLISDFLNGPYPFEKKDDQ